ncbi:MAG: hypothetical protein LBE09_03425 [Christensenellaceae bacterium]|nr:hypothetical protein [Christensenellaceae bacterium]
MKNGIDFKQSKKPHCAKSKSARVLEKANCTKKKSVVHKLIENGYGAQIWLDFMRQEFECGH